MKCFVVDIGNTSIAMAMIEDGNIITTKKIATYPIKKQTVLSSLKSFELDKQRSGAIISSVVPSCTNVWAALIGQMIKQKPLLVTPKLKFEFFFKNPYYRMRIGPDRIADMSAAVWLYKPPFIVMDIGSALTIEIINKKKQFIGGAIAPGPRLFAKSLSDGTSLLPNLEFPINCTDVPEIGYDTISSMQIGIIIGYFGLIEKLIKFFQKKYGFRKVTIYVTGGYSFIAKKIPFKCIIDEYLTLKGLWRIWFINQRRTL